MKAIFSIFLLLSLSSCTSLALKYIGANDKKVEMKELTIQGNKVAFIPMHHIGKPEFYSDVKNKIDSLHALGYICLYEGISKFSRPLDPQEEKEYGLKFRKILGFSMKNNRLKLEKKMQGKYVSQPTSESLGITASDIHADVEMDILIDKYQERFGKIQLTNCDFDTSFDEEYRCGKKSIENLRRFSEIRNEKIDGLIKDNADKKLVIVYGALHYEDLQKLTR